MKYSEFRRWLLRQGCRLEAAKGSHYKVYFRDRYTIFPDHGSKEIGSGQKNQERPRFAVMTEASTVKDET